MTDLHADQQDSTFTETPELRQFVSQYRDLQFRYPVTHFTSLSSDIPGVLSLFTSNDQERFPNANLIVVSAPYDIHQPLDLHAKRLEEEYRAVGIQPIEINSIQLHEIGGGTVVEFQIAFSSAGEARKATIMKIPTRERSYVFTFMSDFDDHRLSEFVETTLSTLKVKGNTSIEDQTPSSSRIGGWLLWGALAMVSIVLFAAITIRMRHRRRDRA